MRKYIQYLLAAAFLVSFSACTRAIIDEGEPDVTGPVNFDPDVQTIMFNNCVTCHSGSAPAASIKLETYQEVREQTESGNLVSRMNDASNPMPPGGLVTLQQRKMIEKWLEDGFPE